MRERKRRKKLDKTLTLIHDLLYEVCWDEERKRFDTRCMSVYEETAEYLAEQGVLIWDECNGHYSHSGARICRFYREVEDDSSIV